MALSHPSPSLLETLRARIVPAACAMLFLALGGIAAAQAPPAAPPNSASAPAPEEEVLFVRRPLTPFDAQLETTVYKPTGAPPWPLVVINHGSFGHDNPHQQARYQPVEMARFFLERGYLVAAPMRQGYSRSTGVHSWRCDHANLARRSAGDIAATIEHFVQAGLARKDQVVVLGQSHGGMVTLGYAASQPVARGVINFAGGINSFRPDCNWKQGMISAARELGAESKVPSLWLYTETDTVFPPDVSVPFFEAYKAAGAVARFRMFPKGGHGFSTTPQARRIWGPEIEAFLAELGLPAARVAH
jgi:dienelactone hydrolase